jgi:transcriptional regulator with XRE-family HTH domain
MGKTLEELLAELSPAQRKRVEARAKELEVEEKTLRDLRQAQRLTQQHMARKLGVKQHSISRMEQRTDMLLSTLRDYIEKMGGELEITAHLPGHEPVRIGGFSDIGRLRTSRSQAKAAKPASSRSDRASAARNKAPAAQKRPARPK